MCVTLSLGATPLSADYLLLFYRRLCRRRRNENGDKIPSNTNQADVWNVLRCPWWLMVRSERKWWKWRTIHRTSNVYHILRHIFWCENRRCASQRSRSAIGIGCIDDKRKQRRLSCRHVNKFTASPSIPLCFTKYTKYLHANPFDSKPSMEWHQFISSDKRKFHCVPFPQIGARGIVVHDQTQQTVHLLHSFALRENV